MFDSVSFARVCRVEILKMITHAGSGHPGGSLSVIDILTVLYLKHLKHNPKNPFWEERDRVILSKGHACPALYTVLAKLGYFDEKELYTLRKPFSRLQGHPARDKGLPGIETSTGSLGQGLSISCGIAMGLRIQGLDSRVYCIMSDGEQDSGNTWEAAMFAGHYKLENLTGIIDYNKLQQEAPKKESMDIEPLGKKYESFGWKVIEIDGHNHDEIDRAIQTAKNTKGKPFLIIAHTVKGKGVSFMENEVSWHGKAPNEEQLRLALKELGA